MPEYQKNSHCSYCGNVTYSNPLPVSVVLLPIDGRGLLLVKRVREPAAEKWGLPGGFIETGETWQEAGAREVFEETGFLVDPAALTLFDTRSAPDGTLLVFSLAPSQSPAILPQFKPSSETSAVMTADGPRELGFSTHTETANRYWKEITRQE